MSRVMVVVFFGWTFFMLLFDIASGDVCLACADAPVTRACHYTRTCESHESCYADAFVNANGDTIFDMGCRDKHICGPSGKREVANRSNGNTLLCTQCCTGNICNAALCGQIGLPPAGPVCFQCDQASTPSTCNTIALCGRDDVCYVEKTIDALSHDTLYKSGCMHKIQCDKRAQLVGRKRYDSTVMSGNDLQVQCCDSYLCNHGNTSTTLGSPLTSGTVAPAYGSLSTNPTLCSRSPCLHGNCFSGSADYFCKCEQGWQGKNCDQSGQGPCSRAPCVHGNCFESSIDYVCQCTNGWTGKNCDQITTAPPSTVASVTTAASASVTTALTHGASSGHVIHATTTSGPASTTTMAQTTTDLIASIMQNVFCSNLASISCSGGFDVICGSDGNYYPNQCEFSKAKCHDNSLTKSTDTTKCKSNLDAGK